MSKKLQLIQQKIEAIRHGLLRFYEGAVQKSMQVSTSFNKERLLKCVVQDDSLADQPLLNREVSLIQKNEDDYLYISGLIDETNCKIISLRITKACWFIRKRKGNAVWLQEKFIYQTPVQKIDKAS